MNENIELLKNKFNEINKYGWIPSPNNRNNNHGVLFEKLIGKEIENFEIPDFNGIEIKTHLKYAQSYITLFNANPEGDEFFEIRRLYQKYSYPSSKNKNELIFQGNVQANHLQNIGIKYKFKLTSSIKENKLYLCIYDQNNNLIEKKSYWSFKSLYEKLYRKLQYLAFIEVSRKQVNGQYFFRYEKITFYKLTSFQNFLQLLDSGKIIVTFTIGVFKKGRRKGEMHNHGTAFRIEDTNLNLLFKSI